MTFEQALCAFLEKKDCEQAKGELLSFGRAAFRAGWLAAGGGEREKEIEIIITTGESAKI